MDQLKSHRLDRQLTQAELAAKVGTSEGYYRKIEAGRALPSIDLLMALMSELEAAPEDLGFVITLVETVERND